MIGWLLFFILDNNFTIPGSIELLNLILGEYCPELICSYKPKPLVEHIACPVQQVEFWLESKPERALEIFRGLVICIQKNK